MKFKSKIGRIIDLSDERKNHIFEYHPDVRNYFDKIGEVLGNPDEIRKSRHDAKVLLFYKFFVNLKKEKYLVVVVKINERNFILTYYFTDKIKTGEKIYEKRDKTN